jgi:hypothetical protein
MPDEQDRPSRRSSEEGRAEWPQTPQEKARSRGERERFLHRSRSSLRRENDKDHIERCKVAVESDKPIGRYLRRPPETAANPEDQLNSIGAQSPGNRRQQATEVGATDAEGKTPGFDPGRNRTA